MTQPTRLRLLKWMLRFLWILTFGLFLLIASKSPEQEKAGISQLPDFVKVYNQDKGHYARWERKEALEFGLNHIASTINYLFVAAAAILGFMGKIIIDPMIEKKEGYRLQPMVLILLRHTAIGCFISIAYGFMAHAYFNRLGDSEGFSIYGELGAAAFCQVLSLLLAGLLIMISVSSIVKSRLESQKEVVPMRNWYCCLLACLMIALAQISIKAQKRTTIYLETDDLFAQVARKRNEALGQNQSTTGMDSQKLERNLERKVATTSHDPERKAAELLLKLQKNSGGFSNVGTDSRNLMAKGKSLRAEALFAEYTIALVEENSWSIYGSMNAERSFNNPVLKLALKLRSYEMQQKLRVELAGKLGGGPEREARAAELILQIERELSVDRQRELDNILRSNPSTMISMPWPLCMVRGC